MIIFSARKSVLTVSTANDKVVSAYYPFRSDTYEYGLLEIANPAIDTNGDIYFALMFNDDNKDEALILTAEDTGGNVYTVTKAAPAGGFANSKYYYGTATLARLKSKPTVTGTSATPSSGHYTIAEDPVDLTISGNSEDYDFEISGGHGGTITLDNLTATNQSSVFISQQSNGSNNQDVSLVLKGTNNISCGFYAGIWAFGNLKLSCIGASATLTVTASNYGPCGIYASNYRHNSSGDKYNLLDITSPIDVSTQLAAPGFTVARSARTDNSDGTFTWTYTVTRNNDPVIFGVNTSGVEDYEAKHGDVISGSFSEYNKHITIPDGATVMLNGFDGKEKAGFIVCKGDATLLLAGSNRLKTNNSNYPALYVPEGKTLTIGGAGSLEAYGHIGAGIGAGASSCGNISIIGGTITAYCGDGAGIGAGQNGANCGTITIYKTVTKVTAYGVPICIGASAYASSGTVTIGGTVYWDGSNYQNGGDTYLTTNPLVYP